MTDIKSKEAVTSFTDPENGESISITHHEEQKNLGVWGRFVDSFKPGDLPETLDTSNMTDLEKAIAKTSTSPLQKSLKNRHLQMIAIGGSIGTGLFVGSGGALKNGGPAALLIAWFLVGSMIYSTVHAIGELAVRFPISGGFNVYSTRFIDPSWGFAMGWNYALQWLIVMPLELVAASITIGYWNSDINPVAWVSIFYVFIVGLNFFGVKGYGEAEFVFSAIKVVAIIGFIILGIVINCGGGPKGGYIGGEYWHNPGAFSHGFKGVCAVFVTAAFSFAGTELVGLAACEAKNPRKSLPKATKQVFWRITLFYMISLTLVGLLVPYNDPRLGTASDASASPFVIAINNAGIGGLPSVMNVVIMVAVLSVGNSSVYAASRTLVSLGGQGFGPSWLMYVDKKGRPVWATLVTITIGLLCFVSASSKEGDVFNWMLAISGLSSVFTWGSVCFAHIRFRDGMKAQGRSAKEELAFTSQCGLIGSWYGVILNFLILVAQFWVALFPLGGSPNASDFFQAYLALPVIIAFYVFHKLWKRNWSLYIRASDMDLDSGRVEHDLDLLKQEIAEEKAYIASKPFYYRAYNFWC
jgi:amino acid transporter